MINKENKNEETKVTNKRKKISNNVKALIALLIIASIATYAYTHRTLSDVDKAKVAEKETSALVKDVGDLMVLPKEEAPAIFVVQDPNVLISQQPFFKGAEKGDKLMVYPKAGKAILYSTSKHMIINVGPVTFDQTASTSQSVAPAGGLQGAPTATTPIKKK